MVVILPLVPALRAQDDESLAGIISCHRTMVEDPQNRSYTKKLWGDYEISLGPARYGGIDGNGCTAAIYNSGGQVVFRTTGFSVVFDENHTGQDFDGDGRAEVVFITDTGGGMKCCWAYKVVSLSPSHFGSSISTLGRDSREISSAKCSSGRGSRAYRLNYRG